ncbi:TolC family protein [Maribacter sp. PR1]|uniref:TolC family protein n=1 Tax=Maribacter cobaltidurans TaxID=1178778 RepID=A0ABU7IQ43_9FLAO|nr:MULTISPECIES: TolC family protein [Maribacter]MDC6387406.1 TolC family protein [Maribacter sp. PR1]MEE1974793.1 TolC family protein [Maribacter cobaltidurans]
MRTIPVIIFLILFGYNLNAQSLESYLEEAVANNPKIQAYELRYHISKEKVGEAQSLPNTSISAGYFVSEPETRTGAQRTRLSVAQMLPWFGTIMARESYASSIAETDYLDLVIAKRKLSLSVAQSYYELFAVKAKTRVLEENIQLLDTYEKLALTSVEVGKASAVDILKLQIRQNELQQQIDVLEQEFLGERANFNNLRNQKQNRSVSVVSQLELPEGDSIFSGEPLELNPELLKYDRLYESVSKSELLNQKQSAPSFGVGLDYIAVSERPNMDFSDNGKDIVMPMVSLSIPLFNTSFKSVSKQNELRQKELQTQKQQRLNVLETTLARAVSQRNQARIAYETLERNLLRAQDAEEILIKNYETGTIDFNDVLDIQELQLKFQVNQIEAVKSYYKQSAIINYLIQ